MRVPLVDEKKQFLIEHILAAMLIEITFGLYHFCDYRPLVFFSAGIMVAVVLLFYLLKKTRKWYKAKDRFSRIFNLTVIAMLYLVFFLAKRYVFFIWVSLLYPLFLLLYVTYANYRYNFSGLDE